MGLGAIGQLRRMNGRDMIRALVALGVVPFASPSRAGTIQARIGMLSAETLSGDGKRIEAVRAGLRERGYVEGKDIVLEVRAADGNYERLPEFAMNLAKAEVDVQPPETSSGRGDS